MSNGKGLLRASLFALLCAALLLAGIPPLAHGQDGGALNVSETAGPSVHPALLVDDDNTLHLLWRDQGIGGAGFDILHRTRTPDGAWSSAANLSKEFDMLFANAQVMLLDPDGRVCVFIQGRIELASQPELYRRCLDGETWTAPELVWEIGPNAGDFRPGYDLDGALHVFYRHDHDMLFDDLPDELSDAEDAAEPRLVVDALGGFHVAFRRQSNLHTIVYRYSGDGGATWNAPEQLSPDRGSYAELVAAPDGSVHAVTASAMDVMVRRWTLAGGWSDPINVLGNVPANTSVGLALAVGPDGLAHVAWHGRTGVFYTHDLGDGTWSAPVHVAELNGGGFGPALAVDADNAVHLAWQNNDDGELYYVTFPAGA